MSITPGQGAIHVALTFDDNFWAPAYAVARSICLTTKRRADVVIHFCHFGLSAEHRADLDTLAMEFPSTFMFHAMDENAEFARLVEQLPAGKRFPKIIYTRLMLDHVLPDVERVIYLDCDTMVLAPIEHLYEQDMKDQPLAAVSDPFRLHIMMGRDMRSKKGIFDPADRYFNSGVLLIDLKRFAAIDVRARLAELRDNGILKRLYYDQDMLNLLFRDRWTELEWRFNCIDPWFAQQALNPYIIHYTGHNRPWQILNLVAFRNIYRHVMTNELYYRFWQHNFKRRWKKRFNRLIGRK
ncbi:MAG: glycosyltransferase family 8 protein [Devosia sp.]